MLYIDLWGLIVDKLFAARSSAAKLKKDGAYATVRIHLSLARILLYFYLSIFFVRLNSLS
jgi:hypothetical protein